MVPSPSFLILLNRFKILSSGNRNELVAVGCRRCCRILAVIIKKRIPRSGEASITESVDRKTVLFLICSAFYSASGYNQIRGRVVHTHLIVLIWPFQQPFGKEWLGKLTWRRPLWPKMKVMISCTLPSRNVMKDLSRWGQIFALPLVFSFHLPPPPFWSTASRYISCLRIFAALFGLYNKWCQRDEADPCRGIYWLAFDYNGVKLEGTSKGFFFLFFSFSVVVL